MTSVGDAKDRLNERFFCIDLRRGRENEEKGKKTKTKDSQKEFIDTSMTNSRGRERE